MRRLRELIAPKHRWRQLTNYVSSFPELSPTWCLTGEKGFSGSLVSSSHPTALLGTVFFPYAVCLVHYGRLQFGNRLPPNLLPKCGDSLLIE